MGVSIFSIQKQPLQQVLGKRREQNTQRKWVGAERQRELRDERVRISGTSTDDEDEESRAEGDGASDL